MTLLELTLALFLSGVVFFSAGNLLVYGVRAGGAHVETQEAFESGRIGLDFLIAQTRTANEIKLSNIAGTDILRRLDLRVETPSGEHVYIFRYDRAVKRLDFGGSGDYPFTSGVNELASGIERVEARLDEERRMLYFSVAVALHGEETVLNGGVDIRYKKIS